MKFLIFYIFIFNLHAEKLVDTMIDYIPFLDELVNDVEPFKVSNPMLNQYFGEYQKSTHINYNQFYVDYNYQHNIDYNCFRGSSYCYFITSEYYTYKQLDNHDYRFNFGGFSPFYADYAEKGKKIIFNME